MQSFKSFIAESNEPFEVLVKELDELLASGSVMKPKFDDLKNKFDRMVDKEGDAAHSPHTRGKGNDLSTNFPGMDPLIHAYTSNLHEVGSLKGKIAKSTEKDHPLHKAWESHYNRWAPVVEKMKKLKTMIVTVTQKRAADKAAKDEAQKTSFRDSHSLISVLSEHKDEFIQRAKERAKTFYEKYIDQIRQASGNLDVLAPRPNSKMSTEAYRIARDRRHFYEEIARKGLSRLIDESGEQAEHDYMAWVVKMTDKIGKVVIDASMTGSPWIGSTISVTCVDGEKQTWHTQMIINQSKYQNLFNQFPSRRVK